MNRSPDPAAERRVLLLAPTAGDAAMTRAILAEAGIGCCAATDMAGLCREVAAGVGVVLLTEEVLAAADPGCLVEALRHQPSWSDVPILLLTSHGADAPVAAWAMDLLGNVTVLERPVRVTTLVSGLRAALRARGRQYELRSQVDTLRKQGERLVLLWEAASVLLTTQNPGDMMRGLFDKLAPHLGLDAYFNYMLDETGDALRLESCVGIPAADAAKMCRLDFGQALCGTVALHRRPVTATFLQQSDDPRAQLAKSYGLRVYACNPLMAGDRLLGTLSFASRSRDAFDADELAFLETVCHYVAYAYERLRLIRQLRDADRKKDDFLATLAHELRNPLAPIRNALQILKIPAATPAAAGRARDMMERQVHHLVRLVDDLLDISRITQGKVALQRERVAVGRVLASAVESCRPLIDAAGHEVTVRVPPEPLAVDGDPTRLVQIFGNLLTNAAKYTDRGGRIRVTAEPDAGDAVVSVADTGIGIAPEHLPRLFDMFSQIDPALDRSQGGLGIGLALVRSLVEMHGGRVEARSAGLGRGSEFVVRLPLAAAPPVAPTAVVGGGSANGTAARPKCKVVVADDNVDAAESLATLLSLMGHEVRTAHDGLGAVEVADGFRPEVVLLDIGMPKLNGYEAARRIRAQPWGRTPVLVALTGWGQEDDKQRATEAGFDRHFTKPVDPAALGKLLAGIGGTGQ